MSKKCELNSRIKENYELRNRRWLTRRTPVIIRIDGKTFSTYCKGLVKPFDEGLISDMQQTAIFLCENIQGAKCAYTQSDEISILVTDYDRLETNAWFDYCQNKIESISASFATGKFNQLRFYKDIVNNGEKTHEALGDEKYEIWIDEIKANLAFFDSRAFNIPKEEVCNYFVARQRDAVKNSISMLAQSLYSHSELHKKNASEMQEMTFQKGHNWNNLHWSKKRGSFIVKNTYVNDKLAFREDYEPSYGDIWYQPENQSKLYPSDKGRLLEWTKEENIENPDIEWDDWCDVPIEKVRTKWEVVETPHFSKQREVIEKYI